jgi:rubrerythrin
MNVPHYGQDQSSDLHAHPDTKLINEIARAINGQYEAIQCYARLAKQAPNQREKERIMEIREDEIRHFREFSHIFMKLTGKEPKITRKGCPRTYREGLHFAIQDELETVDFYLSIADKAKDRSIRKAFKRAALDEQNHATWFLYIYTHMCCEEK